MDKWNGFLPSWRALCWFLVWFHVSISTPQNDVLKLVFEIFGVSLLQLPSGQVVSGYYQKYRIYTSKYGCCVRSARIVHFSILIKTVCWRTFPAAFYSNDDYRLRDFSYYSAKPVNPLIQRLLAGGRFSFSFLPNFHRRLYGRFSFSFLPNFLRRLYTEQGSSYDAVTCSLPLKNCAFNW